MDNLLPKVCFIAILLNTILAGCSTPRDEFSVIAHRGASGYLPENTLASGSLAHSMGADYIEQDVVITRDNQPLIFHDLILDRLTDVAQHFKERVRPDGHYYVIDFDLAEIQSLHLLARRNRDGELAFPTRPNFDDIPFTVTTLDDEIRLVKQLNQTYDQNSGLYIEIKAPELHREHGKDITRIVLSTLAKYGYTKRDDKIYLQSFSPDELKRIRTELGSDLKLIQLIGANSWGDGLIDFDAMRTPEGLTEISNYADGIGAWMKHVITGRTADNQLAISKLVDDAHRAGLKVHVYTLRSDALPEYVNNSAEAISALRKAGVDGVFTDFPDTLMDRN